MFYMNRYLTTVLVSMICSQQLWSNSILDYEKDKSTVKNIYHKGWIDFNKNGVKDIYEDSCAPLEVRVQNLLSQMTLEEKSCQMATLYGSGRVLNDALPSDNWKNEVWKDGIGNIDEEHNGLGSFKSAYSFPYAHHVKTKHAIQRWFVENTRLGIPVDFTNEGIRGLCHDRATYFPAQCGQGATWNKELIAQIGEAEAREASVLGYTNIYSPILDIAQDPRWGRCVETYGEDPYHAGQMGKQMILSLQKNKLVSTPKHFAVYSIPVGGRDGKTRTDPHVAPREMRTLYLDPFRVAFHEAGALGVMSSYNDYDGEPITGSYHFLTEILRQEWGFKGYVVSDSEAVEFISTKHQVANGYEDAVAQAVNQHPYPFHTTCRLHPSAAQCRKERKNLPRNTQPTCCRDSTREVLARTFRQPLSWRRKESRTNSTQSRTSTTCAGSRTPIVSTPQKRTPDTSTFQVDTLSSRHRSKCRRATTANLPIWPSQRTHYHHLRRYQKDASPSRRCL